ncbi:hypothetical protein SAMN04488003_10183 [Loktanella fryxellensis]|uniref:Uncharacterized protein n=1 Tax=Loktanella fryxellensis TaxID=245187 RepID=A0A1H7YCR5_9RHOB|nr:hypothetical protein [Loktanella fryxellensis]SEM43078.1 hypothetical protein SAMN04488003_10183 [Loktanella fryxellensis]
MRSEPDMPAALPLPALRRVYPLPQDQPARFADLLSRLARATPPAPDQA